MQQIFCEGAISPLFIAEVIQKYSGDAKIGAYNIFIGQIRADVINQQVVSSIAYTAYKEMALEKMQGIRSEIFNKYPVIEMEVHHSIGSVAAGEICLFVLAASAHRKAAMEACNEIVERVKSELPIWGKECFVEEGYQWKTNH
ncbi:molybdenum cofactor biosynthesis protein MoaE [Olivibacter domesticus]|uniref:Molybdopterin synthase catalytic subunit n=1 Tax=Olivibacter domesticus TaxID=407022 RepID=A0A1H7MCT4_OLID1|nr:molybdenum cofactor biosynthesis protein MoaE [Olivibacter domesticus]SEL08879.1 molybdopterin synthase catalytic subunit [Olivibacter domesticus]